ncbi:hypothetical protein LP417_09205 [Polaromonas sp. P1-6]|nr:hypothetical protein LP417_09205 [Polaromonas sp. P1-6]UUZ67029.1 hypothetical protein LP416_18880 [Polaromonas sp. P2-4]
MSTLPGFSELEHRFEHGAQVLLHVCDHIGRSAGLLARGAAAVLPRRGEQGGGVE